MEDFSAKREEIAIVGIGCRFPDAKNYISFWNNLKEGKNSIKDIISRKMILDDEEYTVGRWDEKFFSTDISKPNTSNSRWCGLIERIDEFDNQFFNISPREAKNMDPQQRLLLQETWHCIEDSGVPMYDLRKKKTGVLIGVMTSDYHQEISNEKIIIDSYAGLGNYDCILANRISYHFGFTGISMAADAACASSLVAIHQGRNSLLNYESDYILAGGVALNSHPWKYISFSKSRMLSPDGQCKTFDKSANGYVPGEGVAVILMQRLSDAQRAGNHIYGIVKSSHVNHCGFSRSITAPSIEAQEDLIKRTFESARIRPNSISYVEAHGTGTSLGDPIEIEALSKAYRNYIPTIIDKDEFEREIISWIESGKTRDFVKDCFDELPDQRKKLKTITDKQKRKLEEILRDIKYISNSKQFCKIGSLKTNVGHLEACAGIAGVIKVLMMMKYREIPPTLNLTTPNPIVNWETTPFTIAGFTKRLTKFADAVSTLLQIKNISPVVFNARTISKITQYILEHYPNEVSRLFPREKDQYEKMCGAIKTLAIEHFQLNPTEINDQTLLYKKSEQWYPPEINLLVQLLKFKYRMNIINDEIIHSLSIDDIADLLVSIQKETLEEYYSDGEELPEYKLVQLMIHDLVEAVADIFKIPPSEVDISKNIGTFQKTPLRAAVSSFGFGGVNSHLLLEEYPQIYQGGEMKAPFNLFLLSSKTESGFEKMKKSWLSYRKSNAFSKFSIRDICSNLMVGREHFPFRYGFVFDSKESFKEHLGEAKPLPIDNGKLKAIRLGSIEWNGFSHFIELTNELPLFLEKIYAIEEVLKELNIYKTVRDGILQNTWSPKYRRLYSFIINIALLQTIEKLGITFDLIIPDKNGAMLSLVLSGMVDLKEAILYFEDQISTEDLTVTIPRKAIVDVVLHRTVSPFTFTREYLVQLIKGLSAEDSDLDHLYIDTLLENNSADSSIRLATIFKKNGIITEDEFTDFLKIHDETGFSIDEIVREKKRKVTHEEISECLQENDLLRFYVDDIINVDTARQLNENQYTFKGYIDEWNRILIQTRELHISTILNRESQKKKLEKSHTAEKELLLIIISSSLRKLSDRWKMSTKQNSLRPEFNELIDLIVDGVISKEDVINLLLDETPDYDLIVERLNANQFKCNRSNAYSIISNESQKHLSITNQTGITTWINRVNSEGSDLTTLYGNNISVIDKQIQDFHIVLFGDTIKNESQNEISRINGTISIEEEIKLVLLSFWQKGYQLKWYNLIKEGRYNRLALPLYKFNKKSFWIHGKEYNDDMAQDISNKGIINRFIKSGSGIKEETESSHTFSHSLFTPNFVQKSLEEIQEEPPLILFHSPTIEWENENYFHCRNLNELKHLIQEKQFDKKATLLLSWETNKNTLLSKELKELFYLSRYIVGECQKQIDSVLFHSLEREKSFSLIYPLVQGMFRTLQLEHPEFAFKTISSNAPLTEKDLLREVTESPWAREVQYTEEIRFVRGEDKKCEVNLQKSLIRDNKVYLVAGGSGKLGIHLCKTLLESASCTVISLGRKKETAETNKLKEQYSSQKSNFNHLQWNGYSIPDLKSLIRKIEKEYGSIHGVINCAGLIEDGLFHKKEWNSFQKVVSAKVVTTLCLHTATLNQALDFFLLFSSIVSDMGNMGQADYCAANSFLNSFANFRSSGNFPGNTLSVKWSLWDNGGMGLNENTKINFSPEHNHLNPGILNSKKAMRELLTILHLSGEVSFVSNEEYSNFCKINDSLSDSLEKQPVNDFVREIISEKAKIPKEDIPEEEPLFNLGIGSLGIHEVIAHLGKRFDNLSPTLLFEYPNIKSLVVYLETLEKSTSSTFNQREEQTYTISANPMIPDHTVPTDDEELLELLKDLHKGQVSLERVIDLTENLYD